MAARHGWAEGPEFSTLSGRGQAVFRKQPGEDGGDPRRHLEELQAEAIALLPGYLDFEVDRFGQSERHRRVYRDRLVEPNPGTVGGKVENEPLDATLSGE